MASAWRLLPSSWLTMSKMRLWALLKGLDVIWFLMAKLMRLRIRGKLAMMSPYGKKGPGRGPLWELDTALIDMFIDFMESGGNGFSVDVDLQEVMVGPLVRCIQVVGD